MCSCVPRGLLNGPVVHVLCSTVLGCSCSLLVVVARLAHGWTQPKCVGSPLYKRWAVNLGSLRTAPMYVLLLQIAGRRSSPCARLNAALVHIGHPEDTPLSLKIVTQHCRRNQFQAVTHVFHRCAPPMIQNLCSVKCAFAVCFIHIHAPCLYIVNVVAVGYLGMY
jgi:hypothetical protein